MSTITSLGMSVLMIISYWYLFQKMGEPGWKSLIPFYGEYTLFKRIWSVSAYIWYMVSAAVIFFSVVGVSVTVNLQLLGTIYGSEIPAFSTNSIGLISTVLAILSLLSFWAISFAKSWKLSKCFGHGIGFFFGIMFLPGVFYPILAFGASEYRREDP